MIPQEPRSPTALSRVTIQKQPKSAVCVYENVISYITKKSVTEPVICLPVAASEADRCERPEVCTRPPDHGCPSGRVLRHCPPTGHLRHRQHQEVHQQPVCAEDTAGDDA